MINLFQKCFRNCVIQFVGCAFMLHFFSGKRFPRLGPFLIMTRRCIYSHGTWERVLLTT